MGVGASASGEGYLHWSRDPAIGLFAVLPLWLCYEYLRLRLTPDARNGAEHLVGEALACLGPHGGRWLSALLAATIAVAAWSIHRRHLPWGRVALVSAFEGMVYGLMLGPIAAALASSSTRVMALVHRPCSELMVDLVGSLGAGIFEELLFRLVLLSLLSLALVRACAAFGLPRLLGVGGAIVLTACLFSLFHHLGPGAQPLSAPVFVFRAMAGILLGMLFVVRGFGVCVYTHAVYDLHYYLTH